MLYLLIDSQFFLKLLCFLFHSHQTIQLRLTWVQLTIKPIIQSSPVSKQFLVKQKNSIYDLISSLNFKNVLKCLGQKKKKTA